MRAAHSLACGVDVEEAEYTLADAHGNHSVFDIDLCKAVAVAVLGPDAKFTVQTFRDEASALKGLADGTVALVATASPSIRLANGSGFTFGHTILYDSQGFLVNRTMNIHSARDLAGKKVCFLVGTEIGAQATAYFAREGIAAIPGPFSEEGEMEAAFVTRNCAAITADVTQLAYERIAFKGFASQFEILPEAVAKDPLAPVTRSDDARWSAIVDWTMQALVQAEESGVTQASMAEMKKSSDLVIQRLLGTNRGWSVFLGLEDDWAANAIQSVGNYGEIYERDLGSSSVMKLNRGWNNLWTKGGLMYALPMR